MDYTFNIRLKRHGGDLQRKIALRLAELRNTLRSLEEGSFDSRAAAPRPGTGVRLTISNLKADPEAATRACNDCFLDMTRDLITFLDRMISVQRFLAVRVKVPDGISTMADLQAWVEQQMDSQFRSVAGDHRLSNPKKVEEFAGLPDFGRTAMLSYFSLRRCLEHHGGTASKDISIGVMQLKLLIGGQEVSEFPFLVKEDQEDRSVSIGPRQVSRTFPQGTRVALTEPDLEDMLMTIHHVIVPQVLAAVRRKGATAT